MPVIRLLTYVLRIADRLLHTGWSLYGWGLYFGLLPEPVDPAGWTNVCIRCGAARSAARFPGWRLYPCPSCSGLNLFTPDPPG